MSLSKSSRSIFGTLLAVAASGVAVTAAMWLAKRLTETSGPQLLDFLRRHLDAQLPGTEEALETLLQREQSAREPHWTPRPDPSSHLYGPN
jgi:hypothetical protein